MKRPEQMTREELIDEVWRLRSSILEEDSPEANRLRDFFGVSLQRAQILYTLWKAGGRYVARHQLESSLSKHWLTEYGPESRGLYVQIHRIRKRLGDDFILNRHFAGYRLSDTGMRQVDQALGVAKVAA